MATETPRFCDSCRKLYGKKCKRKSDTPSPTKDGLACDSYEETLLGYETTEEVEDQKNEKEEDENCCADCMLDHAEECPRRREDYMPREEDTAVCPCFRPKPEDKTLTIMKETVRKLKKQYTFKTPEDTEEILLYDDGVYVEAEPKIKGQIEKWLGTTITTHFVAEVFGHIRRRTLIKRVDINKIGTVIPVTNGLLNSETRQLDAFDKNRIFTYKLHVSYDETKNSPKWQKFLSQILNPEDILLLQEAMGYCLLPAMPYHHIFFLYGRGRNGKGRVIITLTAFFGTENCSNLPLAEFDENHRFALACLYGKMINISSEPSVARPLQTQILKKITGEDQIDAEIKNKQKRLNFMNVAKPFVLGNRYPQVADDTVAFWERMVMIPFPNSFVGDKVIPNIEKTWTEDPSEMSGILNWMLDGLDRLRKNNGFTTSKTIEENKLEFQRASDTTAAFLHECCKPDNKADPIIKVEFFESYKLYCDDLGLTIDAYNVFGAKIKQQPYIKSMQRRIRMKNEHVWIGVKVTLPSALNKEETSEQTELNMKSEAGESTEAGFFPSHKFEDESKGEIEKGASPASPASPTTSAVIPDEDGAPELIRQKLSGGKGRGKQELPQILLQMGFTQQENDLTFTRLLQAGKITVDDIGTVFWKET